VDKKRNEFLDFVATPDDILKMIERECATVSERRQRLRDYMARIAKLKNDCDYSITERKSIPKMGPFDTALEDLETAFKAFGLYYSELQEEYEKCIFRPRGDHFQIFFNDNDYGLIDTKKGLFDIHCLLQHPNQKIDVRFLYSRGKMVPVSQKELDTYEMQKIQYKTQPSRQFKGGGSKNVKQIKEERDRLKDKLDRSDCDPDDIADITEKLKKFDDYIKETETPKGKSTKFKDQNVETARTGVYKRIQNIFRILEKHEHKILELNGVNPGLSKYLFNTIDFGYVLIYNPSQSEPYPINWAT